MKLKRIKKYIENNYLDNFCTPFSAFAVPSQKASRPGGLGWIFMFPIEYLIHIIKSQQDYFNHLARIEFTARPNPINLFIN